MEDKNSDKTQEDIKVATKAPVIRASSFSSNASNSSGFGCLSSNPFSPLDTNGDMKESGSDNNDKTTTTTTGGGKSFFLRPSPLQHHVNLIKEATLPASSHSNSFKLEPPKLLCPITEKKTFPKEASQAKADAGVKDAEVSSENTAPCNGIPKDESHNEDNPTENGTTSTSAAANSLAATASTSAGNSSAGFVFGSNLADRVLNGRNQEGGEEADDEPSTFETASTSSTTTPPSLSLSLSLAESAAKHQNKDLKPELKEVKVETGEEGESNVLQIFAKLHLFDKVNQAWLERGRGWLRLNDMPAHPAFQSRLVMRAQGTQRVILNMKLWQGMLVDRVSPKNIKLSAIDAVEGLMVYLVTASINDTEQMFEAIKCRSKQIEEGGKKRSHPIDDNPSDPSNKKLRLEGTGDESNDSSAPYPETETSNEGFTSSPNVQSSSPSSEA